ncbi:hypothetical protein T440DRAFT_38207 [Plenodomus tracheiphilus IPT5]|uniref:Uncharacterized protein n=1 Tax=Plenodomus tracheiphilus IPT5 TaxID=1408161 RepID=A0A6A7BD02_9PLEO|nr:hypothetical protein T440DRAFT_38207 [Plenodomus tracheiphilus IPT5]
MGSHINATSLLALPTELREKIYKEVLTTPAGSFDLLLVCREINTQAHKMLYQRSLVFKSQLCLYSWLASTSPEDCCRVNEITVFIQDVDLRPLLKTDQTSNTTVPPSHLLTLELYRIELAKLREAFERLPKVATLTLRVLPTRQTFLYREFLAKVLILLGSAYPTLVELKVEGNMIHQSLDYLTSFNRLRHFTFDGMSASSAASTVETLKRMKHLQSLSMTTHQAASTNLCLPYGTSTSQKTSGYHDFAQTTGPHSLSPSTGEPQDCSLEVTPTAHVLASLRDHETLREMSISCTQEPSPGILAALQQAVGNAGITTLELSWQGMGSKVLKEYALLDHIKSLQIKPCAATDAVDVMIYLWTRKIEGDFTKLRRLILTCTLSDWTIPSERKDSGAGLFADSTNYIITTSGTAPKATNTDMVGNWKKQLETLNVQVLWHTEQC